MDNLCEYASSLGASDEILEWLNSSGSKAVKEGTPPHDLEHVIDWFMSDDAPKRLRKMSVKDALRLSKDWQERNQKKGRDLKDSDGDIEEFMTVGEFKIVKLLTKNAFLREGTLMSHCLGGYTPRDDVYIYSLRDSDNNPHATFEVQKNSDSIVQIKGKGSGDIHPRYVDAVITFLEKLGQKISPREMIHLGYYNIHKDLIGFLNETILNGMRLVSIKGESYLC